MSPRRRKQIDPLEQAIEAALAPGSFISYKAAWLFVDEAQHVTNDVDKIIGREPERAARLFETFIAACHEKAEDIMSDAPSTADDEGGLWQVAVRWEEVLPTYFAGLAATAEPDAYAQAVTGKALR